MVVSMDVGPNRRIAIEVTLTETIFQPRTMTGHQHEGLVVRLNPVAHLRKRMPNVRFVELDEVLGIVWHESQELQEFRSFCLLGENDGYLESTPSAAGFFATDKWASHSATPELLYSQVPPLSKDSAISRTRCGPR